MGKSFVLKNHQVARLTGAIAHPLRAAICRYFRTVGEIEGVDLKGLINHLTEVFDGSEREIEYHVKVLIDADAITRRTEFGMEVFRLSEEFVGQFSNVIDDLLKPK